MHTLRARVIFAYKILKHYSIVRQRGGARVRPAEDVRERAQIQRGGLTGVHRREPPRKDSQKVSAPASHSRQRARQRRVRRLSLGARRLWHSQSVRRGRPRGDVTRAAHRSARTRLRWTGYE